MTSVSELLGAPDDFFVGQVSPSQGLSVATGQPVFVGPLPSPSPTAATSQTGKRQKQTNRRRGFTSLDILSGRGGLANSHYGNRVFRRLVSLNRKRYQDLKCKHEKALLVDSIVYAVQKHGGRFLKFNTDTDCWDQQLSHRRAAQKTSQALREIIKTDGEIVQAESNEIDRQLDPKQEDQKHQKRAMNMHSTLLKDADGALEVVPSMPLLSFCSSGLNHTWSKIAASSSLSTRTANGLRKPEPSTLTSGFEQDTPILSPPPISFDEVMMRQDSLGVSDTLLSMPILSRETSISFVESDVLGV